MGIVSYLMVLNTVFSDLCWNNFYCFSSQMFLVAPVSGCQKTSSLLVSIHISDGFEPTFKMLIQFRNSSSSSVSDLFLFSLHSI